MANLPGDWIWYEHMTGAVGLAAIKAARGTPITKPLEITGGDFSLAASDPQGATFGLLGSRST